METANEFDDSADYIPLESNEPFDQETSRTNLFADMSPGIKRVI